MYGLECDSGSYLYNSYISNICINLNNTVTIDVSQSKFSGLHKIYRGQNLQNMVI